MRHNHPLTRRRFLQVAAAGLAAAVGGGLARLPLGRVIADELDPGSVRATTWTLAASDFVSDSDDRALVSPIQAMPLGFNAAGLTWDGPAGPDAPQFAFRSSVDGHMWSPWTAAHPLHAGLGAGRSPNATDLLFLDGRWIQVRVAGAPPEYLRLTALNSTAGPSSEAMASGPLPGAPAAHGYGLQAIAAPRLTYRGGWGANESYRFKNGKEIWPPEYVPPQKIIIHHTVTPNNEPNPANRVRGIYYYHAVTLAWGDIGYNYLIDQDGRVYVGRNGLTNSQGWPVVSGHASQYNPGSIGIALLGTFTDAAPSAPMAAALTSLVSSFVVRHAIHPTTSSRFVDKVLPNIMGHRDCMQTDCPGGKVYELIESIRQQALGNLPPMGVAFMRNQVPTTLLPGQAVATSVTLRNSGSRTWVRAGATPDRFGARWYLPDGSAYTAEPLELRADLPRDVAPGQEAVVPVRLVAPKAEGGYQLRVDMVQDGLQWFADVPGNQPLVIPVTVATNFKYRVALPLVGRQATVQGDAPIFTGSIARK